MPSETHEYTRLAARALEELLESAAAEPGDLVVVGCSSSEVAGSKIGTAPAPALAEAIVGGLLPVLQAGGLYLAAQCCEHLNRALVVERAAAKAHGLVQVNALPRPHAGGSFATAAWAALDEPVLVEAVRAVAGLDIGLTLIGMHLRPVAVPVRLSVERIGEAAVAAARSRPPFIGGERAAYDERLL